MDMTSYSQGYSIGYNLGYNLGYKAGLADGKKSTDESTAEGSLETVELTEVPAPEIKDADTVMSDFFDSTTFFVLMVFASIIAFLFAFSIVRRLMD